jgi:hypothetical protein
MKQWAWRASLIGLLGLALAGVRQAVPARAAAHQGSGATSIVPATRVVIFHPKGTHGAAVFGACDMGESVALIRADAWRCSVGNLIYDPCFSAAPHATSVICGATPQNPIGIKVTLARPLPTHGPVHGMQAWVMQLGDGSSCTFITGATFGVQGQRANYECSDKDWVVGDPQSGRVWYAVKVQLSPKVGPNGPAASRIFAISVGTVWI